MPEPESQVDEREISIRLIPASEVNLTYAVSDHRPLEIISPATQSANST